MAQEDKLDWMYKGANSLVNREDYLLGRKIDKTLEQLNEEEKVKKVVLPVPKNHVEHECIPPSIRDFNKIVQSEQVDLSAKLQEDPLVAIKKREEEVRRQFLQNPVQLRKLQEALHMKEMEKKSKKHRKENKQGKKFKQEFISKIGLLKVRTPVKQSKQDKKHALDTILMHKFNAFKSKLTEEDLQEVLNGKASSSSDDDTEKKRKSKKQTRPKESEASKANASSSSDEDKYKKRSSKKRPRPDRDEPKERKSHRDRDASYSRSRYEPKDRSSHRSPRRKPLEDPDDELDRKIMAQLKLLRSQTEAKPKAVLPAKPSHSRSDSSSSEDESSSSSEDDRDSDSSSEAKRPKTFGLVTSDGKKLALKNKDKPITTDKRPVKKITEAAKPERNAVKKLSEKEKEKMRQEMMRNAKVRDKEREEHLRKHREAAKQEDESVTKKFDADLIHTQLLKSAKHSSVEDRIKSKLSTIQRSSRHMEQNFSKRL